MKKSCVLLGCVLSFLAIFPVHSEEPALTEQKRARHEHQVPSLTIPEALKIAERYLAEKKMDVSQHFISSVTYHESGPWCNSSLGKGPYWQVTYELKQHTLGGQYFVSVYMDRKVGHTCGL